MLLRGDNIQNRSQAGGEKERERAQFFQADGKGLAKMSEDGKIWWLRFYFLVLSFSSPGPNFLIFFCLGLGTLQSLAKEVCIVWSCQSRVTFNSLTGMSKGKHRA